MPLQLALEIVKAQQRGLLQQVVCMSQRVVSRLHAPASQEKLDCYRRWAPQSKCQWQSILPRVIERVA